MLSSETREEAICRLHKLGHSLYSIHKLTGIRKRRIKNVTEYYDQNHVVPPPDQVGRPSKIDDSLLSKIETSTLLNRRIPWI